MIIDSPIISGSNSASGSLSQYGNVSITGSLTVTGAIIGAITGSADSASFATTASYALSSSYAASSTSASYALSGSYALGSTSASYSLSGSYAFGATSASYALTSSNVQGGSQYYAAIWNDASSLTTGSIYNIGTCVGINKLNPSFSIDSCGIINSGDFGTYRGYSTPVGRTYDYNTSFGSGKTITWDGSTGNIGSLQIHYNYFANNEVYTTGSGTVPLLLVGFRNQNYLRCLSSSVPMQYVSFNSRVERHDANDFGCNSGNFYYGNNLFYNNAATIPTGSGWGRSWQIALFSTARSGFLTDARGVTEDLSIGNSTDSQATTVTDYYFLKNTGCVGAASGGPATVCNYYILHHCTNIGATGTITNRWGLYLTDSTFKSYHAGNLLLGTTDNPGYKLNVSGSGNFTNDLTVTGSLVVTSVTSSLLGTSSYSAQALSSSYASNADLLDNRNSTTFANTSSNTFTGAQYINDVSNAISFTSTASLYTDGGARVTKDMYVSGTAYFNNVTIFGTQSVEYITSSQLNISDNIISVNTATPTVRFGGLAVYDSGSTGLTGSILWDSENNHWVYSNPSGSSYSGGMFISGPRSAALGSEQGTTACRVLVGQGGDHLTSSAIYHDTTVTCIPNTLIGSTVCASQLRICSTGDLSYIYNSGASTTDANFYVYNSTSDILMVRNSGCVGLNISIPQARLDIAGNNNALGCTNTLRFTDTDTATEANQQIGKIEFYSSDTSTPGAGVKAYIGAFASDTTPDAYLAFATQDGSLTPDPVERLRITSEGNLQVGYSGAPNIAGKLFISRGDQYGLTINAFSGGNCITSTDDNIYFTFGATPTLRMICNLVSCFAGTICSPLGVLGEVQLTTTNPRIDYPNGSSLRIYQVGQDTRLEISSTGIASFACQICTPTIVANTGIFCAASTGYAMSVTNVLDDAQGLLIRATDNDPSLFILNAQSSNAATCTGFVSRMAVTKQGRVGIANTAPNNLLEIGNDACLYPSIVVRSQAGYLPSLMLTRGDGLFCSNGNSNWVIANSDNGFEISRVNSLDSSTFTRCQYFQVTCTGNVGINTINPGSKLQVIGSVTIGCSTANSGIYGCYLYFPFNAGNLPNGTARAYIQFDSVVDSSVNTDDTWKWKMAAVARCGNQGCYNSSLEFLRTTRLGVTDQTVLALNGYTGNVGIGISSPCAKFDMRNGNMMIVNTTTVGAATGGPVISLGETSSEVGMSGGISFAEDLDNNPTRVTMGMYYDGSDNKFYIVGACDASTVGQSMICAPKHFTMDRDTGITCFRNTVCAPIGIFSTCVGINVTSPDAPLRIHGGGTLTSTMIIAGGSVGNDNATISAPYSMVFQVDNTGGIGGRSFSFKCGGKGYSDGTTLLAIGPTGNVTPGANGTQDLGSSSLRWCTVYTSDLSLNNGIGNYTIVEGENDLFLYNNNTCKVYKFITQEVCPEMAPAKRSI